jgi:hypothetical protein
VVPVREAVVVVVVTPPVVVLAAVVAPVVAAGVVPEVPLGVLWAVVPVAPMFLPEVAWDVPVAP